MAKEMCRSQEVHGKARYAAASGIGKFTIPVRRSSGQRAQAERITAAEQSPVFEIDAPTADRAAEPRRAHRWRLPDTVQAAIAQLPQIKFATYNIHDYGI